MSGQRRTAVAVIFVIFFIFIILLGRSDADGRGLGRKHSSELVRGERIILCQLERAYERAARVRGVWRKAHWMGWELDAHRAASLHRARPIEPRARPASSSSSCLQRGCSRVSERTRLGC
jgi:hypothetical protein